MTLTEQELKLANLDNLTRLWQAMGTNSQVLSSGHKALLSRSWPHRFWHEQAVAIQEWETTPPQGLIDHLASLAANTVIPVWPSLYGGHQSLQQILTAGDYIHSLALVAMLLTAEKETKYNETSGLRLVRCASAEEIKRWAQIGSEAFAYEIDAQVVQALAENPNAKVMLAYENQQVVATALLFNSVYKNAAITGIHQLGVATKYRGRGIARGLMTALLAHSAADTDYFSLQASSMGKGLYASLGFKEQFIINNYRKNDRKTSAL